MLNDIPQLSFLPCGSCTLEVQRDVTTGFCKSISMNHDNCNSEYERQRLRRIEENKAMLAKLFPEGPSLVPKQFLTPNQVKQKQSQKPRRRSAIAALGVVRRNPLRRARSYKVFDNFEEDGGEEVVYTPETLIVKWRGPLTEKSFHKNDSNLNSDGYSSTSSDESFTSFKRRKSTVRAAPRPAPDIREEDLILVAERVADKRYDSVKGTSCHQCRQKTDDLKTICRSETCIGIRGQFCGPCLRNRYGEDAKKALMDPNWICPPCRGICNCSFCMKKRGMGCTGILIHLAREKGFEDVKTFLGD